MNEVPVDPELLTRVLCDSIPKDRDLDAVHLVGETADNQQSVIAGAAAQALAGRCACFTMIDEAIAGYPGGHVCEAALRALTTPTLITIHQLPLGSLNRGGKKMVNTHGEALAVVRLAQQRGWDRIGVVAAPFHQLRSFISVVTVVLKEYPALKVYSMVGAPMDWDEEVHHSQNTLVGPRKDVIGIELRKVVKYETCGWLASQNAVLEYLNQRDSGE